MIRRADKLANETNLGLVLSGGGLAGVAAEIGALIELEKSGIIPQFVIGTSAGAIVGSLFCSGNSPAEIEEKVSSITLDDYYKYSKIKLGVDLFKGMKGRTGIVSGNRLVRWLKKNHKVARLEDCRPRLYISTACLSYEWPTIWFSGDLSEITAASAAIPLLYRARMIYGGSFYFAGDRIPFSNGNHPSLHIDGGVSDNIAADELSSIEKGLSHVLVITPLTRPPKRSERPNNDLLKKKWAPVGVIRRAIDVAIHSMQVGNLRTSSPHSIMTVRGHSIGFTEPEKMKPAIQRARRVARMWLDQPAD